MRFILALSLVTSNFSQSFAVSDDRARKQGLKPSDNIESSQDSQGENAELAKYPGCEVLKENSLQGAEAKLEQCSKNILKMTASLGLADAKKAISKLKSKRLKDFVALTRTGYGEATQKMKEQDVMAIMKVVSNRAKQCQKKDKQCSTWDVAVQPKQFSMYNDGLYQKNPVLNKIAAPSHMTKMIKAFINFQSAKFEPPKQWETSYHYHTDYVNPNWANTSKLLPASSINGQSLKGGINYHKFYNLSWSYAGGFPYRA